MSEVAFEWTPYALPLDLTTTIPLKFGERLPDGTVSPLNFTGVTFEMRFGTKRASGGVPTCVLDTGNGDITPAAGGQVTLLFRPARLGSLVAQQRYFVDWVQIYGGVPQPFAKGIIIPYQGVKA